MQNLRKISTILILSFVVCSGIFPARPGGDESQAVVLAGGVTVDDDVPDALVERQSVGIGAAGDAGHGSGMQPVIGVDERIGPDGQHQTTLSVDLTAAQRVVGCLIQELAAGVQELMPVPSDLANMLEQSGDGRREGGAKAPRRLLGALADGAKVMLNQGGSGPLRIESVGEDGGCSASCPQEHRGVAPQQQVPQVGWIWWATGSLEDPWNWLGSLGSTACEKVTFVGMATDTVRRFLQEKGVGRLFAFAMTQGEGEGQTVIHPVVKRVATVLVVATIAGAFYLRKKFKQARAKRMREELEKELAKAAEEDDEEYGLRNEG